MSLIRAIASLSLIILCYNSIPVHTAHSVFDTDLSCATTPPPAYPEISLIITLRVCASPTGACAEFVLVQGGNDTLQTSLAAMEKNGYLTKERQVVFIVHGYAQNEVVGNWMYCVGDTIKGVEDSTVIAVSWGTGAATSYTQAAADTGVVAEIIADLANAILATATFGGNRSAAYLYCVGHSLGSHVCGQAGRLVLGTFDRVTGLDPAGPGFDTCSSWSDLRLNKSSALCVDTIHTEGGGQSCPGDFAPYYGSLQSWGHVDTYPNGGNASQPQCGYPHCSHQKAIDYFLQSIRNPAGVSAYGPCSDPYSLPKSCRHDVQQPMGYYSSCHRSRSTNQPTIQPGNFYLTANMPQDSCYYFLQTPFADSPLCNWNGTIVDFNGIPIVG